MSSPGLRSSDAASRRAGGVTRGSSAAADATTTRAAPVAIACSARARADATPKCGASPRYGSTSCDGKRKDHALRGGLGQPFERRHEEPDVAGRLLEVAVARHDVEHDAVRQRLGGPGDQQRLRRRREPGHARGRVHPAARDGGLQKGAKVERR